VGVCGLEDVGGNGGSSPFVFTDDAYFDDPDDPDPDPRRVVEVSEMSDCVVSLFSQVSGGPGFERPMVVGRLE
jgi:hypothetical protein